MALGLVELRARHRHRRLGPRAGGVQQHRRPQADPRAAEHARRGARPAARSTACRSSRLTADGRRAPCCAWPQGFDAGRPVLARRSVAGARAAARRAGLPLRRAARRAARVLRQRRSALGCFEQPLAQLEGLGGEAVEVDFAPFLETARLLYEGPWVAERYVADPRRSSTRKPRRCIRSPRADHRRCAKRSRRPTPLPRAVPPEGAAAPRAAPVLGEHRRAARCRPPARSTASTSRSRPGRAQREPRHYTNFVNLLDLRALAVPAGFQRDGLPFGVTLRRAGVQRSSAARSSATRSPCRREHAGRHRLAAAAAESDAVPLPAPLRRRRGVRRAPVGPAAQPPAHRARRAAGRAVAHRAELPAVSRSPDVKPPRPGLVRDGRRRGDRGRGVGMPANAFGSFVAGIPAPLGIGTLELERRTAGEGIPVRSRTPRGARAKSQPGKMARSSSGRMSMSKGAAAARAKAQDAHTADAAVHGAHGDDRGFTQARFRAERLPGAGQDLALRHPARAGDVHRNGRRAPDRRAPARTCPRRSASSWSRAP